MTTDYASEVFSPSRQTRQTRQTQQTPSDYASEVFGGNKQQNIEQDIDTLAAVADGRIKMDPDRETVDAMVRQQKGMISLRDLPLGNYNREFGRWSERGTASYGAQVKAALHDKPETKLRVFAKDIFPEEPNAIDRFAMVEGVPIYLADDGKLYAAQAGGFQGGLESISADLISNSPQMIGGAAGGAMAGNVPGAIVGGIAGTAIGAGARQLISGYMGEKKDLKHVGWQVTKEGMLAMGGSIFGLGIAKWMTRNIAKDISRLDRQAYHELELLARQHRYALTPAEKTNLPSLKAQQKMAGNMPESADRIDDFLEARAGRNQELVDETLTGISPVDDIEEAGAMTAKGARKVMEAKDAERSAQASPLYKKAFDEFEGFPDEYVDQLADISNRVPPKAINKARQMAKIEGLDLEDPRTTLKGLHYVKLALGEMIEKSPSNPTGNTTRGLLTKLQNELVDVMDQMSPTYGQARAVYSHFTPGVLQVREGLLGRVASVGADAEYTIPQTLLDASRKGPRAVGRAMLELRAADPDAANAALRGFLQHRWAKANKEYATTTGNAAKAMAGARYRAMMVGDKNQADILKAAMTPDQWDEFSNIMKLFEASGRAPMSGSDTAWNQVVREEAKAGGILSKIAQGFSPQDIGNKVNEWLKSRTSHQYSKAVAEAITDPDSVRALKSIRQLPASAQKNLLTMGVVMGLASKSAVGDDGEVPIGSQIHPH